MKRAVLCLVLASTIVITAMFACSYSNEPILTPTVSARLVADNQKYDAGVGGTDIGNLGVPAEALQVRVEAVVNAPAGAWVLNMSADGALTLPTSVGTVSSTTITSTGMTDSVTVEIPVVISQPAGNGYVHLQIGTTHRDFVFVIQAIHPIIQLCLQTVGGTCNSDAGFGVESGKLMGVDVSADGTTETIPLEGTSSDLLHTGDPFLVKVSLPVGMGPSVVGATWRGTVKAVGAIALVSDGGTVASSDVTYTKETNEITLPAVVTGVGVGTISAAVGSGTPTVANRVAVSASQAVYTVKLLRYAGLGAVNQFTVCSTRRSGSLHLQMADAEGSVVPSDVVLTSAIGDCPAGYASHADLVWTGFSANAQLAISDTQGVVLDVVPTIGTTSQVSVRQSAPSVWTCAAESSEINDGGTTSAPTDSGADTKKCPGSASVLVELEFRRSAALPSPNTSDVASAGSTIQVQTPPGISAASSRLVTDLNGKAFLQLSVPKNTVEIPLVITVDSRVTQAVPVE